MMLEIGVDVSASAHRRTYYMFKGFWPMKLRVVRWVPRPGKPHICAGLP